MREWKKIDLRVSNGKGLRNFYAPEDLVRSVHFRNEYVGYIDREKSVFNSAR